MSPLPTRWFIHVCFALSGTLLLATGCSKKIREVNVQVFIVTKGSENVKLGLVEVQALPYAEVEKALKPILAKRTPLLEKAEADIATEEEKNSRFSEQNYKDLKSAETNRAETADSATRAMKAFNKAVTEGLAAGELYLGSVRERAQVDITDPRFMSNHSNLEIFEEKLGLTDLELCVGFEDSWSKFGVGDPDKAIEIVSRSQWTALQSYRLAIVKAARGLRDASEKAKNAADEYALLLTWSPTNDPALHLQLETIGAPEKLYSKLPPATLTAKTDADGRCHLSLPRDQHWILAASASRSVPMGGSEDYIWIVSVSETDDSPVNMSLSNDNLLTIGDDPLALWKLNFHH